jgi:PAS domain S-box-containing protein
MKNLTDALIKPQECHCPEEFLQKIHALTVDDQEDNRILIQHYLHNWGYACDAAKDARDALNKLCRQHYDILITDIKMPGQDGLELTREVRQKYPHISCIIITGYAAEYTYSDIIDTGAADFLVKPFSKGELKAKIRRTIKEKYILQQLQQSEEKFRLLYDKAPLGYQLLDEHSCFVDINQTWLDILGYSREEIIGKNIAKVLHQDDINKIYSIGKMNNSELKLVKKDGAYITALYNDKVSYDDYGNLLQINGIFLDITELKLYQIIKEQAKQLAKANHQLEDQLHKIQSLNNELEWQNKELEAFSYTVSHDLQTPLHVIDGFSRLLLKKYASTLDAKGQDYVKQVRLASQRMGDLIEDLLNFSVASRMEIKHQRVDLSAIANSIAVELHHANPDRNVKFIINDHLIATGDRRLLQIIIDNLLGNAWKYSSRESQAIIELNVMRQGSEEIYFVRDNGVGFDMANADKLFEVFERLHGKDEFPGTGIGLATVQRIITRHGGRVWAESAVGQGTTFYFTLSN